MAEEASEVNPPGLAECQAMSEDQKARNRAVWDGPKPHPLKAQEMDSPQAMTTKELREAAALVLDATADDEFVQCGSRTWNAAIAIAKQIEAEHPADDDEPIAEEWLRSVGFARGRFDDDLVLPPIVRGLTVRDDIVCEYWVVRTYRIPDNAAPRTRGQLRLLCRALGIELKGDLR